MIEININEGGRGFIFVASTKMKLFYLAYWTKWLCPRLSVTSSKISLTFNP